MCDPGEALNEEGDDSRVFIKTIDRLRAPDYNTPIYEETDSQDMALKRPFRRQRSQTLPDVNIHSSSRIEIERKTEQKHRDLRLCKSLELEPHYKGPPSRPRAQSLRNQQRVSFVPHYAVKNQRSIKDAQRNNSRRPSLDQPTTSDLTTKSTANRGRTRKASHSIPSDDINSIYSIVKARSFALKWYKGKDGITKRPRRKQSVPLPTIDDTKCLSLCKAKCSPQFAEVVNLLQKDDVVEEVKDDLRVLSLDVE